MEGAREVPGPGTGAEPGLVGRPASHPEGLTDGDVDAGVPQQTGRLVGELVHDVGSPGEATPAGRRHRHQEDRTRLVADHLDDRCREQVGQRAQQHRAALLLPGDDGEPQHAGVLTGGGDVQRAGAHHRGPWGDRGCASRAQRSRWSAASRARRAEQEIGGRGGEVHPARMLARLTIRAASQGRCGRGATSVAGGQSEEATVVNEPP